MAIGTPIPPTPDLMRLAIATERAAAATLAAALITAAGRPHSVDEAAQLMNDLQHKLYPTPGDAGHSNWLRAAKTDQVHT